MNKREAVRKFRTNDVVLLINSVDEETRKNEKGLVIAIMHKFNVSSRTAREYLNVATYELQK